jgi:hypothetical protein
MRKPLTKSQIWAAPVVLGWVSALGLIAGLLADGIGDVASWVFLAMPVVAILVALFRR